MTFVVKENTKYAKAQNLFRTTFYYLIMSCLGDLSKQLLRVFVTFVVKGNTKYAKAQSLFRITHYYLIMYRLRDPSTLLLRVFVTFVVKRKHKVNKGAKPISYNFLLFDYVSFV